MFGINLSSLARLLYLSTGVTPPYIMTFKEDMYFKRILAGAVLAVSCSFFNLNHALAADFTVVVDPGHGGKDAGAVDNGQREKDINLAVAQKLAAKIRERLKDVKVVMTRDDDKYLTLQERADVANRNKGNLFISIHTNSVDASNPGRNSVAGASVYALGLHKDKNNLQVAMRENSVIELESNYSQKYSGFNPQKDESYIIFEMAQKKNLGQSLKYAELAQKNLVGVAGRADRGVKQAGFWVLWATSMPAVLVELDFICNPLQAAYMGSDKGRDQLAEALYKGLETYLSTGGALPQLSVLGSVTRLERRDTPPSTAGLQADTTRRRRRNEESKKSSVARVVETDVIPLKKEADRLAVAAEEEQPKVEQKVETPDKNRRKETDKRKSRRSTVNKSVASEVVAPAQPVKPEKPAPAVKNQESSTPTRLPNAAQPVSGKLQTVSEQNIPADTNASRRAVIYKIQIASSGKLLRLNSEEFKGLTPIKSFRDGNLYKYTYGESSNRAEIEKLLKKVKESFPDAFIISNKR